MRWLTLLLIGGLVLAVGTQAWALTVPSVPSGVMYTPSRNQDNGTAYWINDPTMLPLGSPITFNPDSAPAYISSAGPRDGLTGEDGWGLALMRDIADGIFKPATNTVEADPLGTYYYELTNASDTWLVGMFWGTHDTSVQIKSQTGTDPTSSTFKTSFEVLSSELHFELWAVEKGVITGDPTNYPINKDNLQQYVDGFRQASNQYTNWLDPDKATWAGKAVKLLDGVTTYHKFVGELLANQKFTGHTDAYFDVDETGSGLWDPYWGTGGMFTDPDGNTADMYLAWDLETGQRNWDTTSHDFGGVNVVPEPVTMASLFLGIGCLSRYIRKRR